MHRYPKTSSCLLAFCIQLVWLLALADSPDNIAGAIYSSPGFKQQKVCLVSDHKTIPLTVEVAASYSQKKRGLMAREFLPENAGMLFTYRKTQPGQNGFWMYNTRIPLDIAFLDRNGKIKAIQSMQPCASNKSYNCPVYRAGVEFKSALEVNLGFFESHGIHPGDQLVSGHLTQCNEPN